MTHVRGHTREQKSGRISPVRPHERQMTYTEVRRWEEDDKRVIEAARKEEEKAWERDMRKSPKRGTIHTPDANGPQARLLDPEDEEY